MAPVKRNAVGPTATVPIDARFDATVKSNVHCVRRLARSNVLIPNVPRNVRNHALHAPKSADGRVHTVDDVKCHVRYRARSCRVLNDVERRLTVAIGVLQFAGSRVQTPSIVKSAPRDRSRR